MIKWRHIRNGLDVKLRIKGYILSSLNIRLVFFSVKAKDPLVKMSP